MRSRSSRGKRRGRRRGRRALHTRERGARAARRGRGPRHPAGRRGTRRLRRVRSALARPARGGRGLLLRHDDGRGPQRLGALYLRQVSDASPGMAAAGFALFSGGMVAGRLGTDRLGHRLGDARFLLGCAVTCLAASVFVVAGPARQAVLAGYGVLGLGLAVVTPVAFSDTARRHPDRPGPAIAAVTMIGYTGFLSGPPVIGLVGGAFGLRRAFVALILLSVAILVLLSGSDRRTPT
ncbi:MFS transporter [Streptomyces sp. NPDC017936]|uniref:MFS transporter n=1 Tax=Streptomyces sp. NPDC017936 TaxID=3365016 RepID=UPI0037ACF10E